MKVMMKIIIFTSDQIRDISYCYIAYMPMGLCDMQLAYYLHVIQQNKTSDKRSKMTEAKAKASRAFTRKHYIALQAVIRDYVVTYPVENQEVILPLIKLMCEMFRKEYPAFDEHRFMKLSGLID